MLWFNCHLNNRFRNILNTFKKCYSFYRGKSLTGSSVLQPKQSRNVSCTKFSYHLSLISHKEINRLNSTLTFSIDKINCLTIFDGSRKQASNGYWSCSWVKCHVNNHHNCRAVILAIQKGFSN